MKAIKMKNNKKIQEIINYRKNKKEKDRNLKKKI